MTMIRKLLTIGAVGLILAVGACKKADRNPDDRQSQVAVQFGAP